MVITALPNLFDPYGSPHCGTRVLATGGNYGGGDAFTFQQIAIPSTASQPVLDLLVHSTVPVRWFFLGISDSLTVQIASGTQTGLPSQNFLATLATFNTWNTCWNTRTYAGNYDLSAFRGQTIQVWLRSSVVTSPPYTTNFSVDDVRLWTYAPLYLDC
jgi:hypothetical protein